MSRLLRIIVGLGLCLPVPAADSSQAIDHEVRTQESGEKSLAATTATTAKQLDALVDEYSYNQICDQRQAAALQGIARSLQALADPTSHADGPSMPKIEKQLGAARSAANGAAALAEASAGEGVIVARIDDALQHAKQFGVLSHIQTLQAIHKVQKRLQDETIRLSDLTIGKSEDEITVEQKVEQGRMESDQQHLAQQLREAIDQLRAPLPPDQQDPVQSERQEKAANALSQAHVDQLMEQAAGGIRDNRLEEVQQQQLAIIEQLQRAERMLFDVPDIDALDDLERRQQQQLDLTVKLPEQSNAAAFTQLQSIQEELAADIKDNADVQAAAPDAFGAATELGGARKAPASERMQKVIDLIRAVREKLRAKTGGKLDSAGADPGGSPDGTCPATTPLWQADLEKTRNHEAWKVGLSPSAREVLTTSTSESFPSAYEQELTRYYRELAGGEQGAKP